MANYKLRAPGAGFFFGQNPDALLSEPGRVMTDAGTPFVVFTPYHRRARQTNIPTPQRLSAGEFFRENIEFAGDKGLDAGLLDTRNENLHVRGGRDRGLSILKHIGGLKDYDRLHDDAGADATTSLSAHNKFGTVSIREVFHAIRQKLGDAGASIVRQLYWRDFFTQLAFFNPHVFGGALKRKFDALAWDNNEAHFNAWCEGRTGFPIVDAGMRQLNECGWMHNRARLIVGSFLTKDLHIDWRRGERYFARQLVDYDPCVNNGNWQWAASVGADTRPIRIFNPWLQQQKFDNHAVYIKRWVPELRELDARTIHHLHEARPSALRAYPEPIIDHKEQFHDARHRYEQVR